MRTFGLPRNPSVLPNNAMAACTPFFERSFQAIAGLLVGKVAQCMGLLISGQDQDAQRTDTGLVKIATLHD